MVTEPVQLASPFHSGEKTVQERMGVRDIEDWGRKVVRPFLPEQHRAFHTSLPFLVGAARDAEGRPWATLLTGRDGFITSPNRQSLAIDAGPVAGDALEGGGSWPGQTSGYLVSSWLLDGATV